MAITARRRRKNRNVISRHGTKRTQPTNCRCMALIAWGWPAGKAGMVCRLPLSQSTIQVAIATWQGCRLVHGGTPYNEADMTDITRLSARVRISMAHRRSRGRSGVSVRVVAPGRVTARLIASATANGNAGVVPTRRKERIGSMTAIAGVGQHESHAVICRSARGYSAVMAGHTLAWHCCPVIEFRTNEGVSIEVAALARRIGHDVAGGFRRRHDVFTQCMATVASPRCALEHATDVASLACRRSVPAKEREASGRMIEAAASGCLRIGRQNL